MKTPPAQDAANSIVKILASLGPAEVIALPLIVAAIVYPTSATCPPRYWINGIRPDGSYQCLLTIGDNDDPAVDVIAGRLSCPSSTTPLVTTFNHVTCRKLRS